MIGIARGCVNQPHGIREFCFVYVGRRTGEPIEAGGGHLRASGWPRSGRRRGNPADSEDDARLASVDVGAIALQ